MKKPISEGGVAFLLINVLNQLRDPTPANIESAAFGIEAMLKGLDPEAVRAATALVVPPSTIEALAKETVEASKEQN